ncbi:hypothetical protein [Rhizobium sp. RAF56]|jgi:hypothetical protein|uniref:hypothetical protein n=1 Tax=Rhizobium sp. RAF56 TaxID=3233062 RepID=UPI003F95EC08
MGLIIWCVVFALVVLFAFAAVRISARRKEDEGLADAGFVILEFGRAFPMEAIRQLQNTADGKSVFVRLHDDKAGFMRNMGRHYACYLIEPGRARATDTVSGRGLRVQFLDAPHHDGIFEFASPSEAAEVALWLLGNYVAADHPGTADDGTRAQR